MLSTDVPWVVEKVAAPQASRQTKQRPSSQFLEIQNQSRPQQQWPNKKPAKVAKPQRELDLRTVPETTKAPAVVFRQPTEADKQALVDAAHERHKTRPKNADLVAKGRWPSRFGISRLIERKKVVRVLRGLIIGWIIVGLAFAGTGMADGALRSYFEGAQLKYSVAEGATGAKTVAALEVYEANTITPKYALDPLVDEAMAYVQLNPQSQVRVMANAGPTEPEVGENILAERSRAVAQELIAAGVEADRVAVGFSAPRTERDPSPQSHQPSAVDTERGELPQIELVLR